MDWVAIAVFVALLALVLGAMSGSLCSRLSSSIWRSLWHLPGFSTLRTHMAVTASRRRIIRRQLHEL